MKKITISTGNTKIGRVHNISLPPVKTCKDKPCRKLCYANKAWTMYPGTRAAWMNNWNIWWKSPVDYFGQISNYLADKANPVELFRWHVGGDIPNINYYLGMVDVAKCHPDVKFLCFTKFAEVAYNNVNVPENLRIVLSAWPGMAWVNRAIKFDQQPERLPVAQAWVKFKDCPKGISPTDWGMYQLVLSNVEPYAQECSGACDQCFMCWALEPGQAVIFKEH